MTGWLTGTNGRRALVIGASGMVGGAIWRRVPRARRTGTFFEYPAPDLVRLDVRDAEEVGRFIRREAPDIVFLPAALSSVDACEMDPARCTAITVHGTAAVARAAQAAGARLVYFSTDYVFDGVDGPYRESDTPGPVNEYGRAKLGAEQLVRDALENHLIVRLSGVFGWEPRAKNFVTGLITRLQRGEPVRVPSDQFGSPTYAENMVDVVLELVARRRRGLFHVAGTDVLSRYAFARRAASLFGLNVDLLQPVETAALAQQAPRPLRAGLRVDKVQDAVPVRLMTADEGLQAMRQAALTGGVRSTPGEV